ncbi:MAG: DUF4446 family protein [Patescibacteria group bacterium]|nr:DUF4446 family protein [Patescibacteria group bacterium]
MAFNLTDDLPFLLALLAIVVLLVWIIRLEIKLSRFLRGQNAKSLEGVINNLNEAVQQTDKINEEITQHLIKVEERLRRSIQHVKTVRFNPFQDQGGNQSFVTAFLDERGNGAVVSSLYSRDKVNVYAKPIIGRRSEYELTDEEQAALQ